MIKAHKAEVVVVIEAEDMVPNNEPLKIKWRPKASEDEDETIGEDPHMGMETTVTNLDTMLRVVSTRPKSKPI